MGSGGSSRPALRTYFVAVCFTGTPVNISELSGGCWGGGGRCGWLPGDVVDRVGLTMPDAANPARGRLALLRGLARRPSRKSL